MSIFSIILLIVIVILAGISIKFLVGLARTLVSLALFILIAGILLSLLTGNDLFGAQPIVGAAVNTVNETIQNVTRLLP